MSRIRPSNQRKKQLWQREKDTYDMAIFRQNERVWHQTIGEALDRMESDDNPIRTLPQYDVTKKYEQKKIRTRTN